MSEPGRALIVEQDETPDHHVILTVSVDTGVYVKVVVPATTTQEERQRVADAVWANPRYRRGNVPAAAWSENDRQPTVDDRSGEE